MKLSQIRQNSNNPRTISEDKFRKLVQSLKNFPQMMELRPIVIDENGIIQGGNMRFRALIELGYTEVPDSWVKSGKDLTPEQWKEFVIKDNLGYGEWDLDVLSKNWDVNQLMDWGMDMPSDWKIEEPETSEDDYQIPKEIETDILPGDIFEIGAHRLICGDSTKTETFERLLKGRLVDLVVTDPPYNVNYEGGTKDRLTISNDNMKEDEFYNFLLDFYKSLQEFTKNGAAWYVWHASSEIVNFAKAFKDAGLLLKQQLIWVKNSIVMGRQDYQWKHEPCLYGWKSGAAHVWYSDRKQSTVLEFDRPQRNEEHPTMKPVLLMAHLIKNSSKQGDIVADAFGGSGTTMVACQQLNRSCYMVEYDPKYCQVILERMINLIPGISINKNGEEYQPIVNEAKCMV